MLIGRRFNFKSYPFPRSASPLQLLCWPPHVSTIAGGPLKLCNSQKRVQGRAPCKRAHLCRHPHLPSPLHLPALMSAEVAAEQAVSQRGGAQSSGAPGPGLTGSRPCPPQNPPLSFGTLPAGSAVPSPGDDTHDSANHKNSARSE